MYLKIKRGIDFILSLIGLIVLAPIFIVLIIAIKLDSPGPVLFKQKRIGIHKTCIEKILRKTSLYKLPQIINILFC